MHACHPGNAPDDWVMPGGLPQMGYRSKLDGMQRSKEVLKKKELKHFKINRELDVLERVINLTNHCRTHKCSDYCLRSKSVRVNYDPNKHDSDIFDVRVDDDGKEYVYEEVKDCRMHFGTELEFDPSGENDRTRGQPPLSEGKITFDKNGIPRYHGRRNHPRVLQEPYNFFWWGCNNDTQKILVSSTLYETVTERGDSYEEFVKKLMIAGRLGLEQYTAIDHIEQYMVGYFCKGSSASAE